MSDTKLFRKSFVEAGFKEDPGGSLVFNDKHKSGETRRLKLWFGNGVFNAPQFAQEKLEERFKANFGHRYLGGQFIPLSRYPGSKSFVIYLLVA